MPPGDPSRPGPARPLPPDEAPPPAELDPGRDLAAALHEVGNALTVLLGWVDAARATDDPHVLATALEIVSSRASHARDIARRAIGAGAASALAQGRALEDHPPPAPVATLVNDAVLGLSMEARRAGVALSVHVDPAAAAQRVPASPALTQILTNLLLNAIAFTPAGASVRVDALPAPPLSAATSAAEPSSSEPSSSPGAILFRVDDEGPGIPPEARERLFESGATSRRGGAGIGLRHSAALAHSSGGALRLADASRGTRFELSWPVASASATPVPASTSRPRAPRPAPNAPNAPNAPLDIDGARILVVEDDDAVIDLLELALEARGATVLSVKARADLPRALGTGTFDAALLDMSPLLGDVEGAVAELRRASPSARLVVMSGSVPQSDVTGAAIWVRKPFEVREIVDALAGLPLRAPSST